MISELRGNGKNRILSVYAFTWVTSVRVLIAILLLLYEFHILQAKWIACYAIQPMHQHPNMPLLIDECHAIICASFATQSNYNRINHKS